MTDSVFSSMVGLYDKFLQVQFFRYLIVGGVSTIVDWIIFFGLTEMSLYYLFALWISFSFATLSHFLLSKFFAFRCRSNKVVKQAGMHLSVSLISLVLSSFLMYVFVGLLFISSMLSRIITTILLLGINFLLHKYLTFGKLAEKEI